MFMKKLICMFCVLLFSLTMFSQFDNLNNENLVISDTELVSQLEISTEVLDEIKIIIKDFIRYKNHTELKKENSSGTELAKKETQISELFYSKLREFLSDKQLEKFKEIESKFY